MKLSLTLRILMLIVLFAISNAETTERRLTDIPSHKYSYWCHDKGEEECKCMNSNATFNIGSGRNMTCGSLGRKSERRQLNLCFQEEEIALNCPLICGQCSTLTKSHRSEVQDCEDKKALFRHAGSLKSCRWVQERDTWWRCNTIKAARSTCPKTCEMCSANPLEIEAELSSSTEDGSSTPDLLIEDSAAFMCNAEFFVGNTYYAPYPFNDGKSYCYRAQFFDGGTFSVDTNNPDCANSFNEVNILSYYSGYDVEKINFKPKGSSHWDGSISFTTERGSEDADISILKNSFRKTHFALQVHLSGDCEMYNSPSESSSEDVTRAAPLLQNQSDT